MEYSVKVGYSTTRPVVPDNFHAFVIVEARNTNEAQLIAAQMVGGLCEMVTSTQIVSE